MCGDKGFMGTLSFPLNFSERTMALKNERLLINWKEKVLHGAGALETLVIGLLHSC